MYNAIANSTDVELHHHRRGMVDRICMNGEITNINQMGNHVSVMVSGESTPCALQISDDGQLSRM